MKLATSSYVHDISISKIDWKWDSFSLTAKLVLQQIVVCHLNVIGFIPERINKSDYSHDLPRFPTENLLLA